MTDISPTTNAYVSDSDILAWLEQKSDEQYGQLDSLMGTSTERANLTQDLTNLQTDIDSNTKSADDILGEMQALQTKYSTTDLGPEVDSVLLPMESKLATISAMNDPNSSSASEVLASIDASSLSDDAKKQLETPITAAITTATDARAAGLPTGTADTLDTFKDDFDSTIKGEVDKLGSVDQLDLIQINEVMSDAHQTMELGSNILSDRDQTSNSILSNLDRA